jgi:deoxyadenosine/deoxycytidine kinase
MSIFQVELGLKFVKEHKELADFIWRNISENETGVQEVGQRFRSAYFAFKHFCRYQKIMESYNDKPCIIEEGLLQKSFLIRDNEKEMLEAVHDYLYLVPLPKAIIYLNTSDAKVILDRLKSRKKTLPNHKDKNDKLLLENIERWQFLFDDIAKSLSKFNIPVYNVDGSKTVKENVQLINHILKNN